MLRITYLMIAIVLYSSGCTVETSIDDPQYVAEIQEWQQKRLKSLKRKTGWLSLIGLHWLTPGENTIGADTSNMIVLPADKAPGRLGKFILKDGEVAFESQPGTEVLNDSNIVTKTIVYQDSQDVPILSHGSLNWFIIKRVGKFGVRIRDAEHPAIAALKEIESYPIDKSWRVEAKFEAYDPPKTIPIDNIVGFTSDEPCPGALIFEIDDQTHRLDVLDADDEFWLIFSDATSGYETYGAGRYLYVNKPDETGKTYIDFNKAYNPPCAYTEFATCPLPPSQNKLSAKITAGEKFSSEYH